MANARKTLHSNSCFSSLLVTFLVLLGLAVFPAVDVFAGPTESGDKCFDGRDNDRDGLIDGEDPDCSGGENLPTGNFNYVLMDSDSPSKPVGELVDIDTAGALVVMPVETNSRAILHVTEAGFTYSDIDGLVYFSEENCIGKMYMFADAYDSVVQEWLDEAFITIGVTVAGEIEPQSAVPYQRVSSRITATRKSSISHYSPTCYNYTNTNTGLYEVVRIGDDFHYLYPPPYTLVQK